MTQAQMGMDGSTLGLTLSRGKRGGWVVWNAAETDCPTAYCSTLAEAWNIATEMACELGKPTNELPFIPAQPQQLTYQPQPQVRAQPAPQQQYNYPPPTPSRDEVETRNLAERIASVASANGRSAASHAMFVILGLSALAQAWPFGA
jgi:hypothetical protein